MPIRTILTLVVAAILGLGAVLLARVYLGRQQLASSEAAEVAGSTNVVVAAQPIGRGVALTPSLLKVARYPSEYAPPGAYRTIEQATAGGVRFALRRLAPNEPILPDRITGAGARANLSSVLTPGMRAVTFRANDVSGVAGLVLPGDRVDVLLTRAVETGGNTQGQNITQVIASNTKVLGVDQQVSEDLDKPTVAKAITLEMSPDEAQALSLAESLGTVGLSLRHISDNLPGGRLVTTAGDLTPGGYRREASYSVPRSGPAPAFRRAVSRAVASTIKVTRGTETTNYTVGDN